MKKVTFCKYQGTGNDFIMIDGRKKCYDQIWSKDYIAKCCHRRYGIGADGLIILIDDKDYDFRMVYYNADGSESTMCGNGGRCIVAFAKKLGIIDSKCKFIAIDGPHDARVDNELVHLCMKNVKSWDRDGEAYVLDTGSPHYVQFVDDLGLLDIDQEGSAIRYNETYKKEGINVNFVQEKESHIIVATYERGVEAQTYSCGTGVVAASIAYALQNKKHKIDLKVETLGGQLRAQAELNGQQFENIWLIGPAQEVFQGEI